MVQLHSRIFRQMKQKFVGCNGATGKNFLKYDGKDASECATRALRGDALDLHFEFPAALRTSGRMLPFFCGQAQCCPAGRTSAIAEAAIVPYAHIRSFEKSGECVTHTQIFPVFPLSCGNIP